MSRPEIRVFESLPDLHRAAAAEFSRLAGLTAAEGRNFTVALSGGSTPRGLYERLAGEYEQIPWAKIHFFWGDERMVPPDHPDSNYRMVQKTLLSKVPVPSENVHRIQGEAADPQRAAEEYEQELVRFFDIPVGERPRFDLVLLGMGPDGHTASLFPGTGALGEAGRHVVANWVPRLEAWRITLTAPVINQAKRIIILAAGEAKAPVLRAVLNGPHRPDQLPVQLIEPGDGRLVWMLDREAAGDLV